MDHLLLKEEVIIVAEKYLLLVVALIIDVIDLKWKISHRHSVLVEKSYWLQ